MIHRAVRRTRLLLAIAICFVPGAGRCVGAETVDNAPTTWTLPLVDLSQDVQRQTIVDREAGQYLGHVTTVLLEDGKTMYAVYPKGHGRGAIVLKRSDDAGRTWSDRLPTPANWATSLEVPTIHRVVDAQGVKRLILWSGLYPARLAVSEDDGATWSELNPVGQWGGIVVMGFVAPLQNPGRYLAMFHDDGRFIEKSPEGQPRKADGFMRLYKTFSDDGGLSWSDPEEVFASSEIHLCEPGCIRSPDGRQLAVLLRENRRRRNSHIIFSNDEGATWSAPRPMPSSLTGDRHTARYAPDGRLLVTFRDRSPHVNRDGRPDLDKRGMGSPTEGDWVAWIGSYDDLVSGKEGQYRVRLMDNRKDWDTCYPGLELLEDGTFVATTYGHWTAGEQPYIVSVRFKLEEIDALAAATSK
ncbi:MAG: exo-alpha-sialidase [Planctomycetales bacterium]|nr:exo-alpha-sialidase [Planctomycetales bacterium]